MSCVPANIEAFRICQTILRFPYFNRTSIYIYIYIHTLNPSLESLAIPGSSMSVWIFSHAAAPD